jgi:DNA-binding CsgD family transcriptional regulator
VCHATCLHAGDGTCRQIAVVIEPARPAEIAPIVVEAHDLTDREQQITRLIARGSGTGEIADELYLSPHTVRGHVKAIFRKLGVTSRGELVAKLFAEHYAPGHHAGVTHVDTSSRIA